MAPMPYSVLTYGKAMLPCSWSCFSAGQVNTHKNYTVILSCSVYTACLVPTVPRTTVWHTVAHFLFIRYAGLTTRVLILAGLQSYIYRYFAA